METLFKKTLGRAVRKMTRIASTISNAVVTLSVRTHKKRWLEVSKDPNPHWDWRNEMISSWIPAGSSVLDLGCGAQTLRRHLKPGCKYQPCDVIKSSPDVIFCDFNAGIYPGIHEHFDYVICSGLFEFIRKPDEFLSRVSSFGRIILFSFCPLVPGQRKLERLSGNWVNHFTRTELERAFNKAGLDWTVLHISDDGQTIYSLRLASDQQSPSQNHNEETRLV